MPPSTPGLTKRELREQRRSERERAERAERRQAARKRTATRLAAGVMLAAALVVAAIVVTSGGSSPAVKPGGSNAAEQAAAVVAGIPETNGVLGQSTAKVTVTEFLDLQCPICKAASTQVLPTLVSDYVRTGKVKLAARTLHFIGDDSTTAAQVAAGAQAQGRLWPFVEAFYASQGEENSGYVTDGFLRGVAAASGVDAAKALSYAKTDAAASRVALADSDASKLGVDSTPTFTVTRGNGTPKIVDASQVQSAIDAALAR